MESSPGYQLMLTSRVHEARIERALERLGITREEFTVLYAIGRGRQAPADIVGFLDVSEAAVEMTVANLLAGGLVERSRPSGSKVHVTDTGNALLSQCIGAAVKENARIRSALTPEEQKMLEDLLKRIRGGERVRRTTI